MAFRQDLTEISSRWKDLGLADSCPFPLPTSDELFIHQKELKTFETAQRLKRGLMSLLDTTSDGWIPTHVWEETKVAHEETFDEIVRGCGKC